MVHEIEDDDVVAPEAVYAAFADERGAEVVRFAGTGHFFHGKLVPLKAEVERVLTDQA